MPGQVIICPVCGAEIPVIGIGGRKRLNIPVKKVYDTLRNNPSIAAAAEKLGCSRGYIYGVLKREGKCIGANSNASIVTGHR